MHWFQRYRNVYRQWWERAAQELADDELEEFQAYQVADTLNGLSHNAVAQVVTDFPWLPGELREFLSKFGVGSFHFPDLNGDFEPAVYHVFDRDEVLARTSSIAEHASRELEELKNFYGCNIHGDDHGGCRTLLVGVRDQPQRFYPLLGPSDVYDFVYVEEGSSRIGRWYHDYPVCELLDGTGVYASLTTYGEDLIQKAKEEDGWPL